LALLLLSPLSNENQGEIEAKISGQRFIDASLGDLPRAACDENNYSIQQIGKVQHGRGNTFRSDVI
jgi:hypothetical protein